MLFLGSGGQGTILFNASSPNLTGLSYGGAAGTLALGNGTAGDASGRLLNHLHMLTTKPTVNGAGSPNDAYLDTTNNKLVLFTGTAVAAEGSGTWKQVSLSNYVP